MENDLEMECGTFARSERANWKKVKSLVENCLRSGHDL